MPIPVASSVSFPESAACIIERSSPITEKEERINSGELLIPSTTSKGSPGRGSDFW